MLVCWAANAAKKFSEVLSGILFACVCAHILVLPCILRLAMLIPLRRLSKIRHAARVQLLPCSAGCDALHVTLCMLEQYNHIASYFHCQKKWSHTSDTCVRSPPRRALWHLACRGPSKNAAPRQGGKCAIFLATEAYSVTLESAFIGCTHKTRSFRALLCTVNDHFSRTYSRPRWVRVFMRC